MRPDGLRLFWSMPPAGSRSRPDLRRGASGDWLNMETAGVSGVMLPLWLAHQQGWIVDELAASGRKAILRILDEDLGREAESMAAVRERCPVELVIVRNEPDRHNELAWGWDWGNGPGEAAERFRDDLVRARVLMGGVPLASGALECRYFREDDPPQPGLLAWGEVMRPAADRIVNAVHAYTYNWRSEVDFVSIKVRLQLMAGVHHGALALTELGIKDRRMTQVDKAGAYSRIMRWLCEPGRRTGERYVMAIPFVSTGTEEWHREGYVLDDPVVYRWFGDFVRGG